MSKCEEKENKMGTLRNDKWRHVWPFFTIMLLHCVAILLFTRGFLLTRTELPHFSHCSDISKCPCFSSSSPSPLVGDTEVEEEDLTAATRRPDLNVANQSHQQTRCWTRPAVDRLIIIVLDALRFDFVAPSTFFEEKRPWMDKLPVLQELASRQGSSTKIFKAIADPPTTSLQRLKGLTTGGLPTFIDVGNSFGAPAILEDNLIYQLAQNGKRVLMMGDDTWLQLFPHHFEKSYPFPSFNVKDLHTVDNGCIDHLFPSLYQEDWDVLIAHFLGVDHAGHIYGVDSSPMIEKLEQYNGIIDKVVEVLKSHSGPGGLHENTFLVVMGDHGQTLNGDHGGGTAEEVETSIFAMSLKDPPCSIPAELDTSFCKLDLDGNELCIGTFQQLDFAVTISALLGIPFPFASIGHVNPQLYALAAGTWNPESSEENKCHHKSNLRGWMQSYLDVLCINAWQVKRFIDVYSASSVIGFSSEDISRIGHMYTLAADSRSLNIKDSLYGNETQFPVLKRQIDAYFALLQSVADLARSKWTEFDLRMMAVGFGVMLTSLVIHYVAIKRAYDIYRASFPTLGNSGISSGLVLAIFVVAVRACSFLSNSYILEEGKVAIFLLATTGIANIRHSIMKMKMAFEVVLLLKLISVLRFSIDLGPAKQGIGSAGTLNSDYEGHLSVYMAEIVPMLALFLLAYLLYKTTQNSSCWGISKCVILGSILSYVLIAIYWVIECKKLNLPPELQSVGKSRIPQTIYGIGLGQLVLLTLDQLFSVEKTTDSKGRVFVKTVAMLSAWSSTVIILLGKQGPTIALASIIGGWCIMTLQSLEGNEAKDGTSPVLTFNPLSVTQWSLFAVCLFFCTGHWCAFDGLRYGAAFIGFDEFILIRQAILLTIDTFGFSHILPIFGLPVLLGNNPFSQYNLEKQSVFLKLSFVYLMYGLIMATSVTFTIICVTIHRRHLMVWGLFAPKFVFDVVGLVLTDALICMASLYYF